MFSTPGLFFSYNLSKKTVISIAVGIVALICLILLFRACSVTEIMHKKVYTVGRDSSWYPFTLYGREKNLVGFTNDLVYLIGQDHDIRFQWIETNPGSLQEGLIDQEYDLMLSFLRPSIVTRNEFVFSELLYALGPVLLVNQNSPITSLKQMQGHTIGIHTGFNPSFNSVRAAGATNFNFLVVSYNHMNKALEALANNQIDGVIMDALPAYSVTQGLYIGQVKVVTPPFTDEGLRFAVLKDSNHIDIIAAIDSSLDKLRNNGTYDSLILKWSLVDPLTQYWKPPLKEETLP